LMMSVIAFARIDFEIKGSRTFVGFLRRGGIELN
jgi:hypothetical protein